MYPNLFGAKYARPFPPPLLNLTETCCNFPQSARLSSVASFPATTSPPLAAGGGGGDVGGVEEEEEEEWRTASLGSFFSDVEREEVRSCVVVLAPEGG